MTENKETNGKKEKKVDKDARTLVIWGIGFIIVVVVSVVSGESMIPVKNLAAMGIVTIFAGWLIQQIHEYRIKKDLKKYDTGTLAMMDTE